MMLSPLKFSALLCNLLLLLLLPSCSHGEWITQKSMQTRSGQNTTTAASCLPKKWGVAKDSAEAVREAFLESKLLEQQQQEQQNPSTPAEPRVSSTSAAMSTEWTTHEKRIMDVYERVSPSVVLIEAFFAKESKLFWGNKGKVYASCGSGFLWDDDDNDNDGPYQHIITNHHVVYNDRGEPSQHIEVSFVGSSSNSSTTLLATIVNSDPSADIAVLQLLNASAVEDELPIPIPVDSPSSEIQQGQTILLFGYWHEIRIVTSGVVSSFDVQKGKAGAGQDALTRSDITQLPVEFVLFDGTHTVGDCSGVPHSNNHCALRHYHQRGQKRESVVDPSSIVPVVW